MDADLTLPLALRFVLASLATWRLTHLLAAEDGPAGMVYRLRARLGRSVIGSLMDCFNCLSLGVGAATAFFVSSRPLLWVMSWLALSGMACLLERMGNHTAGGAAPPDEGDQHVLR